MFYFSLSFPCLPVSEPNPAGLHYKHSAERQTELSQAAKSHSQGLLCNPWAGLDLTGILPQNCCPIGLHEAFVSSIPWLKDPCKSSTILLSSHPPRKALQYNRFSRSQPQLPALHPACCKTPRKFICLTHSDIMLFEQNSKLAKAHQNKSPSNSYTYKQVHIRDRNAECTLTFGNCAWPFSAVEPKI